MNVFSKLGFGLFLFSFMASIPSLAENPIDVVTVAAEVNALLYGGTPVVETMNADDATAVLKELLKEVKQLEKTNPEVIPNYKKSKQGSMRIYLFNATTGTFASNFNVDFNVKGYVNGLEGLVRGTSFQAGLEHFEEYFDTLNLPSTTKAMIDAHIKPLQNIDLHWLQQDGSIECILNYDPTMHDEAGIMVYAGPGTATMEGLYHCTISP